MFNQDNFANILKRINETYDTMTDFGKSASFDRTYISKYINKKLTNPPTPKILEKIAKASHGITSYKELMQICGYLDDFSYNRLTIFNKYKKDIELLNIDNESINELKNIILHSDSENDLKEFLKKFPEQVSISIANLCSTIFLDISNLDVLNFVQSNINKLQTDEFGNPVAIIPILGTVKAGYDYLAQENWIGTVDVDKKLAESGELFALKVHGNSMFPTLMEDDIVIIKKQDDFENGDIVVAIINGDEATIKKGKKSDTSILLQPLNNEYEPLIFTYDEMKSIPVTIIGVVKQLKREF